MDEQLVSYVTFVMWFFTDDHKMGFFVTPVLPYHLPQRRRRVHENACFIPTVL